MNDTTAESNIRMLHLQKSPYFLDDRKKNQLKNKDHD
jgi:hypothetical protein